MSLQPLDYASLSSDAYNDHANGKTVTVNGVSYTIVSHANDAATGFQATAYEHINADQSRSVVIAYRGSEFSRERLQDGGVDAGMVLTAMNAQGPESTAFTRDVMQKINADAQKNGYAVDFTVTGHSLGGTLAEINAHKFGLKGETFNAYGAAGLIGIEPGQGTTQVTNWVRATDVVSAASPHFGQVRVVANQQDIEHLQQHGYTDQVGLLSPRNMIGEIMQDAGSAHAIANFAPSSPGQTLLTPQNESLAQTSQRAISRYRADVEIGRMALATVLGDEDLKLATDGIMRTAHAIEHASEWAGKEIKRGYKYGKEKLSQTEQWTEQKAHQIYNYGKEQAIAGAEWVKKTGQSMEQKAERTLQASEHAWQDFSLRLDHMLHAANSDHWASFRSDQQALASMEPGRQLRENAVQVVNQQEHLAEHQIVSQQASTPAPQQGLGR